MKNLKDFIKSDKIQYVIEGIKLYLYYKSINNIIIIDFDSSYLKIKIISNYLK